VREPGVVAGGPQGHVRGADVGHARTLSPGIIAVLFGVAGGE
jgi:hypothetical protein